MGMFKVIKLLNIFYLSFLNSEYYKIENLIDDSKKHYELMKDNLNCPICLDLFKDPVECKNCAGIMCQSCWEVNGNSNCALCRSNVEFKTAINTIKFLDLL